MTKPNTVNDLLIFPASLIFYFSCSVEMDDYCLYLSEPARSTKFNFETFVFYISFSVVYNIKINKNLQIIFIL